MVLLFPCGQGNNQVLLTEVERRQLPATVPRTLALPAARLAALGAGLRLVLDHG